MANMNVKQTIDALMNFPIEIAILLSGNHGIGKSQVVAQAADSLGIPCIDFRLSQNEVGDLKGMPFNINGRTVFAPPEFFPLREADAISLKDMLGLAEDISLGKYGDKGILFLDEINRANREVQQAAFELVLDRRLNLRSLPEGWRVVAAINGDDDIYTVNAMEPAFLSRFFLIDFSPTIDEWLSWSGNVGVHDSVRQFIRKFPEFLDPKPELLKEAMEQGVKKVHDRRAWEKLSNTILKFEKDYESGNRKHAPLEKVGDNLDYLILLASGFVGHLASIKYKGFVETDYQSLDADTILNKWDDEVEKRLKGIVKIGRIPELAAYNELLIAYVDEKLKTNFNKKHGENLQKYLKMIPKETRANFWSRFSREHKTIAEAWYRSDESCKNIIMECLVRPKTAKK